MPVGKVGGLGQGLGLYLGFDLSSRLDKIGRNGLAHRSYHEIDYDINFWRTKSGQEVDFILGRGEVAIVVCNEREERIHSGIRILPWRLFLQELWRDEIIR